MPVQTRLLLLSLCAVALADHYSTLGVKQTASEADIKKAYRKLALKHHPDKFTSQADKQAASSRFEKIAEAYEVLKDSTKRAEYDNAAQAPHDFARRGGFAGTGAQRFGGMRFFHAESRGSTGPSFGFHTGAGGASMFDFAHFFGGAKGEFDAGYDGASAGLYDGSGVNLLSAADMRQLTRAKRGDDIWLVHFFTRSSHGSKELSRTLKAMQQELKGMIQIAAVDCDAQTQLCERQQVDQMPLVKLLSPDGVQLLSSAQQLSRTQLTTAAFKALPSLVMDLRREGHDQTFFEHCNRKHQGCILLFTDKYETSPLFKRLSSANQHMAFGIIRGAHNSKLAQSMSIRTFPTLQYYRSGSNQALEYKGPINYSSIQQFLNYGR